MIRNWLVHLTRQNDTTITKFIWTIILSFLIINPLVYASEDITLSGTPLDSLISIGRKEDVNFLMELRNPYDRVWHNVKLTGGSSHFFVEIIPETIKQLNPYEEIDVCIKLSLIGDVGARRGTLNITAESDEFSPRIFLKIPVVKGTKLPQSQGMSIIQIDRMADIKTYIYGLSIIILMGFFIWRKIKLSVK